LMRRCATDRLLCFLHHRRPLSAARLPYTTLFRSEAAAQLVENREAVSVDASPVVEGAAIEPVGLCQRVPPVALAEYRDGIGHGRQGQKIRFVFGNEYPPHRNIQQREAMGIQRDIR